VAIDLKDGTLDSEYNSRGLSYSAKGDYDSAISDFTIAIEISPHPLYFNNRGLAYHGKKYYELAIEDFTEAIRLSPQNERLYSNRADTYIAIGQASSAIADLRKTIELSLSNNHSELLQSARERLKSLGVTE
jgi:tetratricopeptide (TPR) repeat protein